MFHVFVCVCVFWSYVVVNYFNFSIILWVTCKRLNSPNVYLGIESYIVYVFKLI